MPLPKSVRVAVALASATGLVGTLGTVALAGHEGLGSLLLVGAFTAVLGLRWAFPLLVLRQEGWGPGLRGGGAGFSRGLRAGRGEGERPGPLVSPLLPRPAFEPGPGGGLGARGDRQRMDGLLGAALDAHASVDPPAVRAAV